MGKFLIQWGKNEDKMCMLRNQNKAVICRIKHSWQVNLKDKTPGSVSKLDLITSRMSQQYSALSQVFSMRDGFITQDAFGSLSGDILTFVIEEGATGI